jgi:acyl-CoA synthetase (NDP forming)
VLDAVGLAARKVGGVVIFSAGFAEGGEEGLAEQREIARLAAGAGMVVEGPNCLGMVNYVDRIPLTFVEVDAVPPAGRAVGNRLAVGGHGGGAGHDAARAGMRGVLLGFDRQRGGQRGGGFRRLAGR